MVWTQMTARASVGSAAATQVRCLAAALCVWTCSSWGRGIATKGGRNGSHSTGVPRPKKIKWDDSQQLPQTANCLCFRAFPSFCALELNSGKITCLRASLQFQVPTRQFSCLSDEPFLPPPAWINVLIRRASCATCHENASRTHARRFSREHLLPLAHKTGRRPRKGSKCPKSPAFDGCCLGGCAR